MSQKIIRLISHFAVYAIGSAVLLASVLVTAVRMVLPDIGNYRTEVEAWVSNYMGYPVAIRSMDANWQGWAPNLQLTNIDLLNQAGTETLTHFASANITVDPIASLLARRIVPRQLVISGFDISIERMENGAIVLQGISFGDAPGSASTRGELADWLFRQERIRIERGTIQWTDRLHGQEPVLLDKVSLSLRSDGTRLQAEGSTGLPPAFGTSMDFAFDARGNLLTSGWSGDFYLAANNINPDNWYRKYRPGGIDIAGGGADIKLWSRWTGAKLASVQGQIRYRDFVTHVGDARLRVDLLDGSFSAMSQGTNRWQLGLKLQQLDTEHGSWPQAEFSIDADRGAGQYVAGFDYLRLQDFAPLLAALPKAEGAGKWRDLRATGQLRHGTVAFGNGNLIYNLGFHDLSISGAGALPAVKAASGRLRGNLDHARLDLNQDAMTIVLPGATAADLALTGLRGTVIWGRSEAGWMLRTGGLALHSPELSARVSGSITSGTDARGPFVDVTAQAGPADAPAAARYLPLRGDSTLRKWLDRALVSGQMLSAEMVLRGHLGEFPFPGREGKFSAIVNTEDISLDYSDKWPPIDGLTGEMVFEGPQMEMRVSGGRIFSAAIGTTTAHIPDIRAAEKRLHLDGTVAGNNTDLKLFVRQSPLAADPVLTVVEGGLAAGDFALKLDMSLPLGPGTPAEFTGNLALLGTELGTGLALPPLRQLTGSVDFTRTSAHGSDIKARIFGQSVTLTVAADRSRPDERPHVTVSGNADDAFIRARIEDFIPGLVTRQPEFFGRLRGTTDFDVTMSFLKPDENGKARRQVTVNSNLSGLAIDLPAPLGKDADSAMTFSLSRKLDTPTPADVEMRYGGILTATISPRTDLKRSPVIAVEFGDPDIAPHSDAGVRVTGTLEQVPTSDWWDVLREVRAAEERQAVKGPLLDIAASGHVRNLSLLGQHFHDVDVAANRGASGWEFQLQGAEVDGRVSVPETTDTTTPLRVDLARLKLAKNEDAEGEDEPSTLDPRAIPPLLVDVADLDFHGHALGAMKLVSGRIPAGMQIDTVEIGKPGLGINGSGTWLRRDTQSQSRFDIHVHADRIDDMLQTFGYNVAAVRKGETEIDISAGWDGAPSDFSWGRLNGRMHMQVRKGQLLDIEPRAGRLFGLLSFQSLPRRLSLDFTDLFGKGMAFDRIEGTFEISDGNAYTNDLHLRGPSAEVAVAGRTGLVVQDYDQVVTVTPQVTGSLPVAGALFGPVGIGIGAVLFLAGEVFGSPSDALLKYQYTVTGSWADPVIEKIEGKDKG